MNTWCCVAARGTTLRSTCVPRTAAGTPPGSGSTSSVSELPGRWIEPCLLASLPLAATHCRLQDMGRRCRRAGPEAWPAPERRVSRGGSWNNKPQNLRSANRNRNTTGNRNNNVGFRVASTAPPAAVFQPLLSEHRGARRAGISGPGASRRRSQPPGAGMSPGPARGGGRPDGPRRPAASGDGWPPVHPRHGWPVKWIPAPRRLLPDPETSIGPPRPDTRTTGSAAKCDDTTVSGASAGTAAVPRPASAIPRCGSVPSRGRTGTRQVP